MLFRSAEVSELLAELLDLGFCLEVLEGTADGHISEADGDSTQSSHVEFWVPLHDVEGALG